MWLKESGHGLRSARFCEGSAWISFGGSSTASASPNLLHLGIRKIGVCHTRAANHAMRDLQRMADEA